MLVRKSYTTRQSARMSPSPPLLMLLLLLCPMLRADDDASVKSGMRGHLEAFGKQGPSSDIDQVDGFLPPKEFVENYVMQNKPLLFKGAAKLSPAFTKWTDQYLMSTAPPRPAGDVFIEHSKKENRSQAYNFVHLKAFLETYNTSNIYMVSEVPEHLLQDVILPYPLQCKMFLRGQLDTHVVWFSSGGTSSVIHTDAYENINCLYRGRKTVVFANSTRYNDRVNKIVDNHQGSFSTADVDQIDLVSRPEFRDLEFHTAEMNAGDCLYIPLFWIHQVRSFDSNLAVNIWWPSPETYNLGICAENMNTKLNFGKVYFKTIETAKKTDSDNARKVFESILQGDRTEAELIEVLSLRNADVAAMPEFRAAVSRLFKCLDTDMSGALSDLELRVPLKPKQYRPFYKAIMDYNVLVFRMHEATWNGPEADKLPRLLRTQFSDNSVYAEHRTWPLQDEPLDADEEEPLEAAGKDGTKGDRQKEQKEEL